LKFTHRKFDDGYAILINWPHR